MARPIDPNREELKREILDHAARVFAAHGYRNTTTEDLADKVQLKKSSLYHYFDSKEAILYQALSQNLKRSLAPLEELVSAPEPPAERLRRAIAQQAERMMDAPYAGNLF